jgi:hypothetical protein
MSEFSYAELLAARYFENNINLMVPWYLMASYAYYKDDDPIFSDSFFDNMGRTMYDRWDDIEHFHKDLITKSDLKAGTYLGEYPQRVIGGLNWIRSELLATNKKSTKKAKKTKKKG